MATPRRSVSSLVALLSAFAILATALPAGAAAHLADLKSAARPRSFTLFESDVQLQPQRVRPSSTMKV